MNGMAWIESGYDYVVVGAGSAGCVLAARLSAPGPTSIGESPRNPTGARRSAVTHLLRMAGAITGFDCSPYMPWR